METFIGKSCPFCKTAFKEEDSIITCPSCGIPHHESCWTENGGCTTFGCSSRQNSLPETPSADLCPNCRAPLNSSQLFCSQCGMPRGAMQGGGTPKSFCRQCGAELPPGQNFCPQCGCRSELMMAPGVSTAISQFNSQIDKTNRRKKSRLPIILVLAAVLFICAAGGGYYVYSSIQEQKREKAAEKYLSRAKSFASQALLSGAKMEDIGNEIQQNWRSYIYDTSKYYKKYSSIEDAVSTAQEDQADNISYVESYHSDLEDMYTDLRKVPEDSDYEDIKEAVEDVYDAYLDMYECVMNVSGNYTSFTSEFSDTDSEFSKKLTRLSNILEDYD